MKKTLFFLSVVACLIYMGESASAQAAFRIPEEVTDFKDYSIPEHCIALMKRLNKQLAPEQDTTFVIQDILAKELSKVRQDTTPIGVRENLVTCGTKFREMKVPADSVYRETMDAQIADALLLAWGARDTGWFFSIINDDMRKYPTDSVGAFRLVMSRVTDAMFSFLPVNDDDFRLWDSLYTAIVIDRYNHPDSDLKVFSGLISSLSQQARILAQYDRDREHQVLHSLVSKVDSLGVSDLDYDKTDHPLRYAVHTIKYAKRLALLSLNNDSLIDTLRTKGPARYIDALVKIEHISGFRDAILPQNKGIGRNMRALPGHIVYRDGKLLLSEGVTHAELLNEEAAYLYDPARPYVVAYMESLCSTEASMPTDAHRALVTSGGSGQFSCLRTMEALKWIRKNHPDIQVILWTPFRGQVGTLLTETPAKEAKELVKALDEFYSISADVVMYNTESYNMPDSYDRRRIDISIEFLEWFMEMSGSMYERTPKMFIVSPGGKIMSNTYSFKVLNAMMDWYRNSSNLAGLGNRD